ncbi:MAG: hypothetical protein E7583_09745, partial [Ruminococcaceae bacterium]|nr:hypothetical protein [Oscillospiraceae bacterium]
GTGNSVVKNNTTLTVDGAKMLLIGLGKGNYATSGHNGRFDVVINSGEVTNISMNSDGTGAANSYKGVRYFVLNGGKVYGITTTGSASRLNNSTEKAEVAVADRTGVTVFEINKAGILDGNINLGQNKKDTTKYDVDDAKRIILFNNNSYESYTYKHNDTTAITIAVTNGALKADVTMNADYTTVLNGYSYTTDSANKYININGTNYSLSDFTNVDDVTLAEEITVLIPATLFEAGENTAVFSETPLYEIKWVDGEETVRTDGVESGVLPTAPELTKTGYTLSWDPEVVEASADATYTAVWTVNKHNVIYTLDGTEYNKTEVAYGETVNILPAPEAREGYTFSGWSKTESFTMPDEDVTITGTYVLNNYTITFVDGEDTYEVPTKHGETPVAPVLTKTGHTLDWDKEIVAATEATTYTAVWTANNYTVTYKVDGEAYGDHDTYAYGANVTMREAPAKTGYTFSGWDKTLTTMPSENVEINGTFTANEYTVTYKVDGEVYGNVETYAYGADVTMRDEPTKDGYTFSGWDKTLTTMPAENVVISGTFTKNFATTPIYNTYGYYDALAGTYKVELKFSGAKVNQGSFGFVFPAEQMTFKSVTANSEAGIEFLKDGDSPIYANGEGYYANTWAVGTVENAGHIDATTAEVLVATLEFTMSEAQRTAFEQGILANGKLEEYKATTSIKYYNGTNYIVTIHAGDFSFDRQAVVYEAHHDEVVASGVKYYTYGKYDTLREEYAIEIKVKGAKINLGAFGIAFNESYMTFDPDAQDSVTMADGIANYLDIVINNTKEGYAFGWDGSSTSEGYVDASENEVLIATIKTKMTAEQRVAFENAGKTMSLYDASNIEEDISKYYDGENYLVSVYVGGLATPKLATKYEGHSDEVLEVTEANVEVTVNFTSKLGETKANIAYIKLGDEVTALETAGNAETSATKTYEYLKVGQSYKIRVEKNGYLAAEVDYTVAAGDNKIVINLIAGDIKGAETATCGDGTIDLSDFVRLIRAFDVDSTQTFKDAVDIDENGAVNVSDLAIIKANYNKTSAKTVITYNGEEAAG